MMHEFYTITMNDRYKFSRLLAIFSGIILFSLIFCSCAYDMEVKYVSIAILPILMVMVNSLYVRDKTEFGKFSEQNIPPQTLGKRFGKKLFPDISPKKTWAGFWGGMFCSVLSGIVMKYTMSLDITLLNVVLLAIVMDIAGVYGDLFESQWKRHYNVKDSGTVIPGHGGMLDRFDSTIFAMPIGALYLIVMNIL